MTDNSLDFLRVMVIDDQRTMRRIVRALLKDIGINKVTEASNGAQALEMLETLQDKHPDLILCDLHMEKMDGLDFCNRMRLSKHDILRQIPVIVLTGENDSFVLKISEQVGAKMVLSKPISAPELRERIAEIIGFSN